jgi:hypothetical protein
MMQRMRTTLTLDPDVAARLKRLRQRRDARFKDIVNAALREGLRVMEENPRPKSWTKPMPLGGTRIGSLDNIADVLAIAERETFK